MTIAQILDWADLHHEYTGRWPTTRCGPLMFGVDRTWEAVNTALSKGSCGLPGGSSLRKLLRKKRDIKDPRLARPDLTVKKILEWADLHHQRTGQWPYRDAGRVAEAPDVTWNTVDRYLKRGRAQIEGGTSLAHLLRDMRGVWDGGKPQLSEKLVLRWADIHHNRTGHWPVTLSGPVFDQPGEMWSAIDVAMRNGRRGLGKRISLSQLLMRERRDQYRPPQQNFTVKQILAWADAHFWRNGKWPTRKSGPVYGAPGVKWSVIDLRLNKGGRGLPGGSSLARMLDSERPASPA